MSDKTPGVIDPELVRELAAILRDAGLSEIEIEHGGSRLKLARQLQAAAPAPAMLQPTIAHVAVEAAAPAAPAAPAAIDPKSHPGAVLSPMVGTAYLSPEPGAAAFIKPGDTVAEGQTLIMVEAMKTFNPIPAPRAGKVARVLVVDGQPVEFGEALVILE